MLEQHTIGIIAGTIWGNRGAESMLVTTIAKIKEKFPKAEFKVFSYSPKKDRSLVKQDNLEILDCTPKTLVLQTFPLAGGIWLFKKLGINFPDHLFSKEIQGLKKCKVLLDISGISFVDGRELYLPFNVLTIWPAMMMGIPVVKLSQALGPFKGNLNQWAARVFLSRCEQIFTRGLITTSHLKDFGLTNFTQAADIAFMYQPSYSLSNENETLFAELGMRLRDLKKAGNKIVTLVPSSLVYQKSGEQYLNWLIDLMKQLNNKGVHYLVLANSTREGVEQPRNNDLFVLELLDQKAQEELSQDIYSKTTWFMKDLNTRGLRHLMGFSNVIITSRFHAMVSSLSLGIPVIVMGWSHKYVETLMDFGMEEYVVDYDDTGIDIVGLVRDALENQEMVSARILDAFKQVQLSSKKQFDYLETILNE